MDNNTPVVDNKKKSIMMIVIALVVVALASGLVMFLTGDEDDQGQENTDQPQSAEEAETTEDDATNGTSSDGVQEQSSETTSGEGQYTSENSPDDIGDIAATQNTDVETDLDASDWVLPSNIEQAKKYYCMVQEGQSGDNWETCLSETQCVEEPEEIFGNFTCQWEGKQRINFVGGTVRGEMLKE